MCSRGLFVSPVLLHANTALVFGSVISVVVPLQRGGRGAELQMEYEGSEIPNVILPLALLCSLGCCLPEAQGAKWKLFIFSPLITESLRLEKTSKITESNQSHVPGRRDRSAALQSAAGVQDPAYPRG